MLFRSREIGLRKAIGATEKDISGQFLVEAVILTAIGGVIGILLGVIISFIASIVFTKFMGILWEFSFSIWAAALGLFVSSLVGLTFGYYPAKKAAEKNPIEALRYE